MDKVQLGKALGIGIAFIIALAAVFGVDVTIIPVA